MGNTQVWISRQKLEHGILKLFEFIYKLIMAVEPYGNKIISDAFPFEKAGRSI